MPSRSITIQNQIIEWKQELKYLGVVLVSAKRFKINNQSVKHKFFRAVNSVFGKVGLSTSAELSCSLINAHCIPILLFASEALYWSAKNLRSMANVYNQAFYKIFKTFDNEVIRNCQFYMNILPFNLLIDLWRLNFVDSIKNMVIYVNCREEIKTIMHRYGFVQNVYQANNWKAEIWKYFDNEINI